MECCHLSTRSSLIGMSAEKSLISNVDWVPRSSQLSAMCLMSNKSEYLGEYTPISPSVWLMGSEGVAASENLSLQKDSPFRGTSFGHRAFYRRMPAAAARLSDRATSDSFWFETFHRMWKIFAIGSEISCRSEQRCQLGVREQSRRYRTVSQFGRTWDEKRGSELHSFLKSKRIYCTGSIKLLPLGSPIYSFWANG